jgi:hypothetical protein
MKSILDTYLKTNKEFLLKRIFVYLFTLIAFNLNVSAQTTFTTSGSYTIPVGVTCIKVECWGAGGGGSSVSSKNRQGGGGGGGAYATSFMTVIPGTNYTVVVGAGGPANTSGGATSFNINTVIAAGGSGAANNSTSGAAGGTVAASTGSTVFAGGNGANGATYSGGGGGGAGSAGTGGNASGGTAGTGTALYGGSGGSGVTGESNGNNGTVYGGGGSGASKTTGANFTGGAGAGGLVVVTIITNVEVNATSGLLLNYYATLKDAFDKINDGTHRGAITVKINGNTVEASTAVLNANASGSANYTSVTIYPTGSGLSVSGSLTTPLIQLNGADNVTLDGRVNQNGSSDLTISNTNTGAGARTIELINSAQNNNIQYCDIQGAGSTITQGTINLSTAGSGTGNDGNYISYCNISGINSTIRPVNAIYSAGTAGFENSENIIRNNNIYDFLKQGTASNGIYISSNSTAFSITGNSFYETASFAPTSSVEYAIIRINNASGNDFLVSNNYIGGSDASCGGTAWTKTNAFNNTFNAIYLNVGTSNNNIQNNTIQNFTYANSGNANWCGIYAAGGILNIGTTAGNTIGTTSGTGSITFTGGATGASFYGLYIATANTVTCSNNIVGSVTTAASSSTNATNFYGINKTSTAGTLIISNNIIGSASVSNSINVSSLATGASQILYGIYTLGTGAVTISGNTVANLINSTTETTQASQTRGIFANAGSCSIENNTVDSLKTGGLSSGSNYDNASIVGISLISTVANQNIPETQ